MEEVKEFNNPKDFITNTIKDETVFDDIELNLRLGSLGEIKGFKYSGESVGMYSFKKRVDKIPEVLEVKDNDGNVTTKGVPEVPAVDYEMKVMVLPKGNRLKVYLYKNGRRVDTFTVDSPHELVLPGTEKE